MSVSHGCLLSATTCLASASLACSCSLLKPAVLLPVSFWFKKYLLQVFKPTMPFSAAYLAANSAFHFSPTANCFTATFVFLVAMSQQFHAWGHMKKSDLPAAVVALQVCTCSMLCYSHGCCIFADMESEGSSIGHASCNACEVRWQCPHML